MSQPRSTPPADHVPPSGSGVQPGAAPQPRSASRRRWLGHAGAIGLVQAAPVLLVPARVAAQAERPSLPFGLQSGDPVVDGTTTRAIVWTRADRPARVELDWSLDAGFARSTRVGSLLLNPSDDGTGRIDVPGLPAGARVHVRMTPEGLDASRARGEPVTASFDTPATGAARDVRFVWGGDVVGQGWGISTERGGMTVYDTMRRAQPQFFLHSGDAIYADNPIKPTQAMPDGSTWTNLTTPEKSKVAETLDEFRGAYRYNLHDEHLLAFNRDVPQIWQWDDHEVSNNWSASKDMEALPAYTEKSIFTLAARAAQAFREYAPIRASGDVERDRIYRRIPYGPLLDVFVLDMRSYRGPNSDNLQPVASEASAFMGRAQLDWLKASLAQSRATWKVIAADMPIGLGVPDGRTADGRERWEAVANNEPGAARGRELEIAELLSFLKRHKVRDTVWLTADVHYCAAHHYRPEAASFRDFDPFWEFVAGPLHAGAFGPAPLDGTFGPEAVFVKAPSMQNEPPSDTNQFFGQVDIDARTHAMRVALIDRAGTTVFSRTLPPWRAGAATRGGAGA